MVKQNSYWSVMISYSPWKFEALYRLRGLFTKPPPPLNKAPISILLSNQGSLGDVYLTTCLIPALKKKYLKAKIGLLIDPKARLAAQDCPGIDEMHLCSPWFHYLDSPWKKLTKKLRFAPPHLDYEWVIQTDPYFRGMGSALKHIPRRTCFSSISDRIYFNEVLPLDQSYIGRQLEKIAGPLQCPWSLSAETKPYALFHLGSSDPGKEVPLAFWSDLYASYKAQGHEVLFTGSGVRDIEMIEKIAVHTPTTFAELVQRIKEADHIVTVDTVVLHIAISLRKKTYALIRNSLNIWSPLEGELIQW